MSIAVPEWYGGLDHVLLHETSIWPCTVKVNGYGVFGEDFHPLTHPAIRSS